MTNSFFDTVRVFVLSFISTKKIDLTTDVKKETVCHKLSVWDHVKRRPCWWSNYFLLKNLPENGVYFAKKRTPFTIFKNYIFQTSPDASVSSKPLRNTLQKS